MKTILFFLGVLYIAVLGSSCTAYKAARQTKKDNKIIVAAITNPRVSKSLDAYFTSLRPLQKPVLIKGKDSIIEVPVIVDRVHDSIIHALCPDLNLDSLRKAVATTKTILRIDTLRVADSSCEPKLQIATSEINTLQGKLDQQASQLQEEKNNVKEEKKRGNKKLWYFIAACVFILLENGLIIYKRVK
jgi:hypothetical protein